MIGASRRPASHPGELPDRSTSPPNRCSHTISRTSSCCAWQADTSSVPVSRNTARGHSFCLRLPVIASPKLNHWKLGVCVKRRIKDIKRAGKRKSVTQGGLKRIPVYSNKINNSHLGILESRNSTRNPGTW